MIDLGSWTAEVKPDQIPAALAQLAAAQSTLTARLLIEAAQAAARQDEETNWLSVEQAAAKVGRSPRWFYRNAKRLPFIKRLSRKVLLVSESGMMRWVASQKA
ncbi:MAG TPA: hypothetical protein VK884_07010 [Verrucomicrobiae bacterium]|jgi:hypothetical protein|nr:hypothetical protein [Verrucomicrobiae bacterium]